MLSGIAPFEMLSLAINFTCHIQIVVSLCIFTKLVFIEETIYLLGIHAMTKSFAWSLRSSALTW